VHVPPTPHPYPTSLQGSSTTSSWDVPLQVQGLPHGNVTDLQLGKDAPCAVINASSVWCWGENYYGQLGDGTTTDRYTPVKVKGLSNNITQLSVGYAYSCVIEGTAADGSSGAVKCWGYVQHSNHNQIHSSL